MKTKINNGFTIVELLVVIVVIGILAAITVVAFNGVQDRAKYSSAHSSLRSLNAALKAYHAIHGQYPATGTTASPGWRYSCATGINNFMIGVSDVAKNLPQAPCADPAGTNTNDTWLYASDGVGYKLVYIRALMSDGAKSHIPVSMRDPARSNTAWGYWTEDTWRTT